MMHRDEIAIDAALVRRLLEEQFGAWAELPLTALAPPGTVNAMFRLGQDKCVRLPRLPRYAAGLKQELRWLPALARQVSLAMPEPLAAGRPSAHFPLAWAVYRWLDGEEADRKRLKSEREAAERLALFVRELRSAPSGGGPRSSRDRPLAARDGEALAAIGALPEAMDRRAIVAAWRAALRAPKWSGAAVWTHGDLLPPNLIVRDGRLTGIIDFGNMGVGDPAVDLIPAWTLFSEEGRQQFRDSLDVDSGTWARSRGFALHQALLIIPYYRRTNPAFAAMAQRTVEQVLDDLAAGC